MPIGPLPEIMAWRHVAARDGCEVAFCRVDAMGISISGHTTAVEEGRPWSVQYDIRLDSRSHTRAASVTSMSAAGSASTRLLLDAHGRWLVDGVLAPSLDGCLDVDLEASALTNAFPVRRLRWIVGRATDVPVAYVRAPGLEVGRLEQTYTLLASVDGAIRYRYSAPAFDFTAELTYDASSFLTEYPGLAVRVV